MTISLLILLVVVIAVLLLSSGIAASPRSVVHVRRLEAYARELEREQGLDEADRLRLGSVLAGIEAARHSA